MKTETTRVKLSLQNEIDRNPEEKQHLRQMGNTLIKLGVKLPLSDEVFELVNSITPNEDPFPHFCCVWNQMQFTGIIGSLGMLYQLCYVMETK